MRARCLSDLVGLSPPPIRGHTQVKTVQKGVVAIVASMFAFGAWGATISGPSTSSTGTFTLTWPSGYELRLNDASWRFAGPPTTSYAFSSLPSGTYTFSLVMCWADWETGLTMCGPDAASVKAVTVTRDSEPAIDTSTTAAGTMGYTATTSLRGSSRIDIPLKTIPGINGHAPALSLVYDSARGSDIYDVHTADDSLGYAWRLDGLSRLHRCRVGLSGTSYALLDNTDRLCLDGQPLKVIAGAYWADNSEYRTELQSYVKVTKKPGNYFEVRYPDGRVALYGDTAESSVVASGLQSAYFNVYLGSSPTYVWGVRQVTNGFGDVYTVEYHRVDAYGVLLPKKITYSGATVEFKYGPRSDLSTLGFGYFGTFTAAVRLNAVLHTIKVAMNGTPVREYRLDSNLVSSRLRLEQIQECGNAEGGGTLRCLKPLTVGWVTVSGGPTNFPIGVSTFTDGLGAQTKYAYSAITTSSNPITYTEAPFGSIIPASGIAAQNIAAVNQMQKSDGLTSSGLRTWTYRYKSYAYRDASNRGYIGFYERRVKDEQSGVNTYTQTRMDTNLRGLVSAVRAFTNVYGSGLSLHARNTLTQSSLRPAVRLCCPTKFARRVGNSKEPRW